MSLARVGQGARRHHQYSPLPLSRPPRPNGPGIVGRPPSPCPRRACDPARLHPAPCQTCRRRQCRLFHRPHSRRQAPSVLPCAPRLWATPRCTSQTSIIHRRWRLQPSPSALGGHAKQLLCAESIELRLSAVPPFARARSRHSTATFPSMFIHIVTAHRRRPLYLSAAVLWPLSSLHAASTFRMAAYHPFVPARTFSLAPRYRHFTARAPRLDTQTDRGTTSRPIGNSAYGLCPPDVGERQPHVVPA